MASVRFIPSARGPIQSCLTAIYCADGGLEQTSEDTSKTFDY